MENYVKADNGVVINNNIDDFEKYKMKREKAIRDKDVVARLDALEKNIESLKCLVCKLNNSLGLNK